MISSKINRYSLVCKFLIILLLFSFKQNEIETLPSEPVNVLSVICDDLNTVINPYTPNSPVKTPAIDRLADRSVVFKNAHCNNSICAPSRASLFSGLYPHTTGNFWFQNWKRNKILNEQTMMQDLFKSQGYQVLGTGKLLHHIDTTLYHQYGQLPDFGSFPWNGKDRRKNENQSWYVNYDPHPDMIYLIDSFPNIPFKWEQTFARLSNIPVYEENAALQIPGYSGWVLDGKPFNYTTDENRNRMPDEISVDWALEQLNKDDDRPFFIGVGYCRPHTPLYVPDKYFNLYPLDSLAIPAKLPNDLEDCAQILVQDESLYGYQRYKMLENQEDSLLMKKWLQAYYASISFVDDQLGRLLDGLEKSKYADNTIIVFTSDNGYMMGQKDHLHKHTIWREGTRVPLMIAAPEFKSKQAHQPVSLIDLYPTLVELCDLNADDIYLDGHSLVPLLQNPAKGQWKGKNIVINELQDIDFTYSNLDTVSGIYYSLCSKNWRYTLCADSTEELYNLQNDPLEWNNLSTNQEYSDIKTQLKNQLLNALK